VAVGQNGVRHAVYYPPREAKNAHSALAKNGTLSCGTLRSSPESPRRGERPLIVEKGPRRQIVDEQKPAPRSRPLVREFLLPTDENNNANGAAGGGERAHGVLHERARVVVARARKRRGEDAGRRHAELDTARAADVLAAAASPATTAVGPRRSTRSTNARSSRNAIG